MKRLLLALLFLFGTAIYASAQPGGPASQIQFGPTDPATCTANIGQVFYNTTSDTLKHCSATNTWTAVGGGTPYSDSVAILYDNGDMTKLLRFELSGFTTGNTRVITPPNSNTSLPIISQTLTFTGPTQARTFTLPDADSTLAPLVSPSFTTPSLGVATATSINKVALTAPATGATLTISDGGSLITSGGHSITLTSTGATNVILPTTGTLATLAGTEALSGKTLTAPKIANADFIADANGNELVIFTTTASAINELTIANAASGGGPTISATGDGSNIPLTILTKGSGALTLDASPSGGTIVFKVPGSGSWRMDGAGPSGVQRLVTIGIDGPLLIGSLDTAASPMYTKSNDSDTGLFYPSADNIGIATGGIQRVLVNSGGVALAGTANAANVGIKSISESITLSTSSATTDSTTDLLPADSIILAVVWRVTTTIADVDSTAIQFGDASVATRFGSGATLTAGATGKGYTQLAGSSVLDTTGPTQAAAAKLRITLAGGVDNTPSAGVVRVTVFYLDLTAPTS